MHVWALGLSCNPGGFGEEGRGGGGGGSRAEGPGEGEGRGSGGVVQGRGRSSLKTDLDKWATALEVLGF